MNILLLGGTGFIGNAIFHSLVSAHSVTIGARTPIDGYKNWKYVNFFEETNWEELLKGIDLVINAIGIIEGDFLKVQTEAPLKLYDACAKNKVRIIHISAIGAEKETPSTDFLATKKTTDDFLLKHEGARLIYPGIVLGKQGRSASLFAELAQFPVIPLLSNAPLPFVHVSQVAELVQEVVENFENTPHQSFAISEPETLKELFLSLRNTKPLFFLVPKSLLTGLFFLFPNLSIGLLNKNTMRLLNETKETKYPARFPKVTPLLKKHAPLIKGDSLLKTLSLFSICFVWVWSGISSLVSWDESTAIMEKITANKTLVATAILSGSIIDIFLGVFVLIKKYIQKALFLQMFFIGIYTIFLSYFIPEFWLHPFGVLSKNLPLLLLSIYLATSHNTKG